MNADAAYAKGFCYSPLYVMFDMQIKYIVAVTAALTMVTSWGPYLLLAAQSLDAFNGVFWFFTSSISCNVGCIVVAQQWSTILRLWTCCCAAAIINLPKGHSDTKDQVAGAWFAGFVLFNVAGVGWAYWQKRRWNRRVAV